MPTPNQTSVEKLNQLRLEIAQAEETLEKLYVSIKDAQTKNEGVLEDFTAKLGALNDEITAGQSSLNSLVAQKNQVQVEIATLSRNKDIIVGDIEAFQKKSALIQDSVTQLQDSVTFLNTTIAGLNKTIALLQDQKSALSNDIATITNEIKKLKIDRDTADQDYMASAKRLISIAGREQALIQRETFIKAKYEDAGIPYQPIPTK